MAVRGGDQMNSYVMALIALIAAVMLLLVLISGGYR